MKRILTLLAAVLIAGCGTSLALDSGNGGGDTNKVEYWCPNGGIKYEPVSTPFIVPAPPDGKVWTLLVLKAGSEQGGSVEEENQQFPNPVVGQAYSRTDGKGISHAILCYDNTPTTTTMKTTTTLAGTTTTTGGGTTTTQPSGTTTTTVPSGTTTTQPGGTTTTTIPTGGFFSIEVEPLCPDGTEPQIAITFGDRPDLDGQIGTLTFSTGGSIQLEFNANNTVPIQYPDSAGTGPVTMTYTLGSESVTRSTTFPEACDTTTTTATTTTTPSGPTTTIPVGQPFSFGAAATVCVAEVPTIRITFVTPAQFPSLVGQTGTLTMTSVTGGGVVSVQPLVYQPGATIDILYPGTRVNADGSIADVPGWTLNSSGFWVPDPNDQFLRNGIILTYVLNPTATATVTYPPESATCANPNGPFPPGVTPPPPGTPIAPIPGTPGGGGGLPPTL